MDIREIAREIVSYEAEDTRSVDETLITDDTNNGMSAYLKDLLINKNPVPYLAMAIPLVIGIFLLNDDDGRVSVSTLTQAFGVSESMIREAWNTKMKAMQHLTYENSDADGRSKKSFAYIVAVDLE